MYSITLHLFPIFFDAICCVWGVLYLDSCVFQQWPFSRTAAEFEFFSQESSNISISLIPSLKRFSIQSKSTPWIIMRFFSVHFTIKLLVMFVKVEQICGMLVEMHRFSIN